MPQLWVRVFSSVAAMATLAALYFFGRLQGLQFLCFASVIWSARELIPILFQEKDSLILKSWFFALNTTLFILCTRFFFLSSLIFAIVCVVFCSTSLLRRNRFEDLNSLSIFWSKSILGFFYVGLLPVFAERLLSFSQGEVWFFGLLAVVLAGDSFAYFFGKAFGAKKLMPEVSPKKTVVGFWGGLIGSLVAGFTLSHFLPQHSLWLLLVLCFVTGLVGQMGDLFESTLKRVAHIKDSGSLMPGHGGILDRIDGILFASPIFLAGAFLLDKYLAFS